MRHRIPPGERGAALLVVLLLVAVIGAIAAAAVEKLRLTTALAINSAALDQARAFAIGVESLLTLRIDDLIALSPERTTLAGGWNGEARRIPLPGGGVAEAIIRDGGNCFNINSLAEGSVPSTLTARPTGTAQFAALLGALDVPQGAARRVAEGATDWVDADAIASRDGAEDPYYVGGEQPYRTGNTYFSEVSELRTVTGMTPEIYAAVRPWLCALPSTELSPINVNTLTPEQAPLLVMLAPQQIDLEVARRVIASRPADGWSSLVDFYQGTVLASATLPLDVQLQPQLRTRWFELNLRIELRGSELVETALIDARVSPSRVAVRRWGGRD